MQQQRTPRRRPLHPGATPFKRKQDGEIRLEGYRAQVIDPLTGGKVSANKILGIKPRLYPPTKQGQREASEACWLAEDLTGQRQDGNVTVAVLRERWLARTHNGTRRLKESTQISNAERTAAFAAHPDFRDRPIGLITEAQARAWAETVTAGQREAIKSLFNYAVDQSLLPHSPFRSVKVGKGRGNEEVDPPSVAQVERLIVAAYQILPSWGAWLEFGAWVGTRPGEADVLRFSDFEEDFAFVRITRQWNQKTGRITTPKHVHKHLIAVPPRAQMAVKRMLAESRRRGEIDPDRIVFLNTRGGHFTQTSRAYYWKATKAAADATHTDAGETITTYLATRHFCGWFMVNVLGRPSEDVAHQLRHDDGGELVRKNYGHRDRERAARENRAAYHREDRKAA